MYHSYQLLNYSQIWVFCFSFSFLLCFSIVLNLKGSSVTSQPTALGYLWFFSFSFSFNEKISNLFYFPPDQNNIWQLLLLLMSPKGASDFAFLAGALFNFYKVPLKKGTQRGIRFQWIQSRNKTDPTHFSSMTANLGYRYWSVCYELLLV